MKRFPTIFGGILGVFALSFLGLAMMPHVQLGSLQPQVNEEEGDIYPINAGGEAAQGRQVYVANGCVYCHTQQVHDPYNSADIQRGWGTRRTVARDYIYDEPVLLGNMRNGPDLANIGARTDEHDKFKYTAAWHFQHLYMPRIVSPGSIMPSFSYLFEKRKIIGQRSADALNLTGVNAPPGGYEIVPTREAKSLVAYLLSQNHDHPLKEAGAAIQAPGGSTAGKQAVAGAAENKK